MKIKPRTFVIEDKKDWQLVGEEMSKFYGRPMYSVVNMFKAKRSLSFVKEKFLHLEKEKDRSFQHLMQHLWHN